MKEKMNWREIVPQLAIIFLVIIAFGILLLSAYSTYGWLNQMYYARVFSNPGVIAACQPDSLFAAQLIAIFIPLLYLAYIAFCFEKKKRFRIWTLIVPLLTVAFAFPQTHGQIRLYEDGRLIVTNAVGNIKTEHRLDEALRAKVNVAGRITGKGARPGYISITVTYDWGYQEAFSFSINSFNGENGSQRLRQMLSIRKLLPKEILVVNPYTQDNLQEAFTDSGLIESDWAAVNYLLAE